MIYLPEHCTLHIETRDDAAGIWLCLDTGRLTLPLAEFVSEDAVQQYTHAIAILTMKAHAMGRAGI